MNPHIAALVIGLVSPPVILYFYLWRALLCLAPSTLRIELDAPPDKMQLPAELKAFSDQLLALGFTALGSRLERPRLHRETEYYEFARPADHVFATLYLGKYSQPRLYLLTRVETGFVITANYPRPARQVPGRYLAGGLEDFSPDRVYRAHLRRLEGFTPTGDFTLEGRLAAAQAWLAGPGKREVRLQNLHGLLLSGITVGMVAYTIIAGQH